MRFQGGPSEGRSRKTTLLTRRQETSLQRTLIRALTTVFHGKILSVVEMQNRVGVEILDILRDLHLMTVMVIIYIH